MWHQNKQFFWLLGVGLVLFLSFLFLCLFFSIMSFAFYISFAAYNFYCLFNVFNVFVLFTMTKIDKILKFNDFVSVSLDWIFSVLWMHM